MKPNKQCINDIMKYIENNTKIEVCVENSYNITIRPITVSTILNEMEQQKLYSLEEIAFNILQCYKLQLIDINFEYNNNTIISSKSNILGITFKGMDFIEKN